MNLAAILILGILAMPVAAGAAWVAKKSGFEWTARQRVFNSAAIAPAIIAVGAALFGILILTKGGAQNYGGADVFLLQAITTVLAAFVAGMLAAYLVERLVRR